MNLRDPMQEPDMVEVKNAKTVESAVQTAMKILGIEDPELVVVEVVVEPMKWSFGTGGRDGVVRVYREEIARRHGMVGQGTDGAVSDSPGRPGEAVLASKDETDSEDRGVDTPDAPRSSEEMLEQAKKWMNRE